MSLEKEVMLIYGSNLDIYNIKVKKFISPIRVEATFADVEDRLKENAKRLGANAIIDVKTETVQHSTSANTFRIMGSSGNAVIVEGQGYNDYVAKQKQLPKEESEEWGTLPILLTSLCVIGVIILLVSLS